MRDARKGVYFGDMQQRIVEVASEGQLDLFGSEKHGFLGSLQAIPHNPQPELIDHTRRALNVLRTEPVLGHCVVEAVADFSKWAMEFVENREAPTDVLGSVAVISTVGSAICATAHGIAAPEKK